MLFTLAISAAVGAVDSPIKADEVVVFFPTVATLDPDGKIATLAVHGWIYEPEDDSVMRRTALGLFAKALGFSEDDAKTAHFKKRAGLFLVDNQHGKKVPVRIGDQTFVLEESAANGHFRGSVRLPAAGLKPGWLGFQAVTRAGDDRKFEGRVLVLGETGLSVVSDIDDTIKVSDVRNKKALLANTFLKDYQAVAGMPELYNKWAKQGASFHYVSASPWQLYAPLAEFFDKAGYPHGSFHLKSFRLKDSSFFNLFASPEKTKNQAIEPLLQAFPKRKFLLIGDSGEKDPEIYAELARKHPQQIERILIRDVTGEDAKAERYRKCFEGVARDRWQVFREPKEID